MYLFFYQVLVLILIPFALAKLIYRSLFNQNYLNHVLERFGIYKKKHYKNPIVWIHAVSVGESNAIKPLVDSILKLNNSVEILITHGTLTGREVKINDSTRIHRAYLPYDLKPFVKNFLNHFKPNLGLIIETEIWPNLIHQAQNNKIPLFLINGRLSQRSLKKYLMAKHFFVRVFEGFQSIYAQSDQDKNHFAQIYSKKIYTQGNLKFDYPLPEGIQNTKHMLIRKLNIDKQFVMVAGSTRQGEELELLKLYKELNHPKITLIIVPRHPQRFREVEKLIQTSNFDYVKRTTTQNIKRIPQIILGDSMGEMFNYYAMADFIIMGGSIKDFGSQNPIEALKLEKRIAIGPSDYNFKHIIDDGTSKGIFIRFKKLDEIKDEVLRQVNHKNDQQASKKIKAFIKNNSGASVQIAKKINQYL